MNIIRCDKACIYQRDGYCGLDERQTVYNGTKSGCAYIRERETEKKKPEDTQIL